MGVTIDNRDLLTKRGSRGQSQEARQDNSAAQDLTRARQAGENAGPSPLERVLRNGVLASHALTVGSTYA